MPDGQYNPDEIEQRWQDTWNQTDIYAYQGDGDTVYSVDTPPPTVSGDLHMGHMYGNTLMDFMARFKRMYGEAVYFPFGFDDNGIASERLTEKERDIRHQDYDRREFQQICREVCETYESQFEQNIKSIAMSVDWSQLYRTIEPRVQRISQLSFIDLYEKGREYRKQAPAIWCPECETAISQVEAEDAEKDSTFNDIRFDLTDGSSITISTTRPELLPACVSIFVHPDDEEHADLVGKTAEVPLFGREVPIIEDERVDMEKGSGIVMCCTFGDQTDIEWYQAHDLPLKIAIDESGTMTELAEEYEGMSTKTARKAIIEDLDDEGHLLDQRDITHTVNVHERCDEEIEFLVTEQWYVKLLDKKEEYLEAGQKMDWQPEKMFTRYEHWIEGLEWDWCISRQRDSGIPFPVWYCADCGQEVLAAKDQLPVDPIQDEPPVDACPECGHDTFTPEEDVFDTWATSSLTPLINAGWDWDEDEQAFTFANDELYPMTMRPQGHDIISFWLFHTVVKCLEHTGEVPFDTVMIHGWVLDEHSRKMSKSKGNVVTPEEIMDEYPVDAIRYWAAGTSVGEDFPLKDQALVSGEKMVRKIWNASKLVEDLAPEPTERPEHLHAIDRWMLAEVDELTEQVATMMNNYDFNKAREKLRAVFWHIFCDDYLEIVKQRLREGDDPSGAYAIREAHRRLMKAFAPILPHVTEEIWQDMYADTSIHAQDWPEPLGIEADRTKGRQATQVISALRTYKNENGMALNDSLGHVVVYGDITGFEDAIADAMHIQTIEATTGEPPIEATVTGIDLDYATIGPKYGDQVSTIEQSIETGDYEIDGDTLKAGDITLGPDEFEKEIEHTFTGEGSLRETDDTYVVVREEA
ncbi:MAG: valine--tRNA ligase [Candidatus Nanohaloarchaeota archaeon QJJ-5]|nr:valine--tRNA ligase [Candidatus Nanohaloarchaeota archaeon QJJ-5]